MIYRLSGKIIEKHPNSVVIDVCGVGYEASVSLSTYSLLPDLNEATILYTHMAVREDGVFLYGFATIDEKKLFQLLTTVSGIGPKLAIKILSGMGLEELKSAIGSSDYTALASVSGVGKKTAERIVVELKDKFDGDVFTGVAGGVGQDVVSALMNLGYKLPDCRKALEGAAIDADFQTTLKMALNKLTGKK